MMRCGGRPTVPTIAHRMQALWMIVASLLFAFMGVCVKYAAVAFTSAEMICYRGIIGMLFMWGFARMEGVSLRTRRPRMHVWRSLIGVAALGMWFYAIAYLPLATANSLNYMSSIWIAVFVIAGSLLSWIPGPNGQRAPIDASLVISVIAGFVGVLLLLRPELPAGELFAGIVGLLSGLVAALAYLQVAALSKAGEPETRTVFYFGLGCTVCGAIWTSVGGFSTWSWSASVWLLPIGILAALGQWCMTRAYADAHSHTGTLVVANLQYSGILFSAVLGKLAFGDQISLRGWIGIGAIIASGIVATVIRTRAIPAAPAEEH
jgi:drug/metabolite transporter (DMT)-like permease